MVQTGWVRKHFIAIQFQEKRKALGTVYMRCRHVSMILCRSQTPKYLFIPQTMVQPKGCGKMRRFLWLGLITPESDFFRAWRRFINRVWVKKLSRHSSSMDFVWASHHFSILQPGFFTLKLAAKAHENQIDNKRWREKQKTNSFAGDFFVSWVSWRVNILKLVPRQIPMKIRICVYIEADLFVGIFTYERLYSVIQRLKLLVPKIRV